MERKELLLRHAARWRHGLESRRNSFAGLVELNRYASVRKIQAVRAATIQQTMPGSVRQPASLKTMPPAALEALVGRIFVAVVIGRWIFYKQLLNGNGPGQSLSEIANAQSVKVR
jgi:hypothetical protein